MHFRNLSSAAGGILLSSGVFISEYMDIYFIIIVTYNPTSVLPVVLYYFAHLFSLGWVTRSSSKCILKYFQKRDNKFLLLSPSIKTLSMKLSLKIDRIRCTCHLAACSYTLPIRAPALHIFHAYCQQADTWKVCSWQQWSYDSITTYKWIMKFLLLLLP